MTKAPRYNDPGQPGHVKRRWCPHLEVTCDRGCPRDGDCKRKVESDEHRAAIDRDVAKENQRDDDAE